MSKKNDGSILWDEKAWKGPYTLIEEQMTIFIYDLSSNWNDDCSIA